jgi:hypothetical protein
MKELAMGCSLSTIRVNQAQEEGAVDAMVCVNIMVKQAHRGATTLDRIIEVPGRSLKRAVARTAGMRSIPLLEDACRRKQMWERNQPGCGQPRPLIFDLSPNGAM